MYNIYIGSDHAGVELKQFLIEKLSFKYKVQDYGTNSTESVDYPDIVHNLIKSMNEDVNDVNDVENIGILICASGNGVCITANKYKKIRAALCWNKETAILAKQHNNANVICLPARYTNIDQGLDIALAFLNSQFEGGRHQIRIDKI